MDDLPYVSFSPYTIYIEGIGPVAPPFPSLDVAVRNARSLQATGLHIASIANDEGDGLKDAELHEALGPPPRRRPLFTVSSDYDD
jgi:hypothetical protein